MVWLDFGTKVSSCKWFAVVLNEDHRSSMFLWRLLQMPWCLLVTALESTYVRFLFWYNFVFLVLQRFWTRDYWTSKRVYHHVRRRIEGFLPGLYDSEIFSRYVFSINALFIAQIERMKEKGKKRNKRMKKNKPKTGQKSRTAGQGQSYSTKN